MDFTWICHPENWNNWTLGMDVEYHNFAGRLYYKETYHMSQMVKDNNI